MVPCKHVTYLVELKILRGKKREDLSVYLAKKNITINSEGGMPVLEITNDYDNSLRYEISDRSRIDNLAANLW